MITALIGAGTVVPDPLPAPLVADPAMITTITKGEDQSDVQKNVVSPPEVREGSKPG